MGLLRQSSSTARYRRGSLLAAVVALHAGALILLVNSRIRPDPMPQPEAIHVALLTEEEQRPRQPELLPQLPVPPVQVVVPLVEMPEPELPPPRAIIVQASPEPMPPANAAPTPAPMVDEGPVLLASEDVDYLRMPDPAYPRAARQARLQGTVLVWVLIDVDGRPKEVRVHRSSGFEPLDREGRDAVARALFKPHRQQGVARMAQAIVPVEFSLAVRTANRR